MKRVYIFKDGMMQASTVTRDSAIDLIRRYQKRENHPFLKSSYSIIEGEEEFVPYPSDIERTNTAPKRDSISSDHENVIILSDEELTALDMFLSLTEGYRRDEKNKWENLADEKKSDGKPRFIHAADNADVLERMNRNIEKIRNKLNNHNMPEKCHTRREMEKDTFRR